MSGSGKERPAQRVIVTVSRPGEVQVRDLELPAEMPVGEVARRVAMALRWESPATPPLLAYRVEAHPPGLFLTPDQSLAAAGVWDGAWLLLHPTAAEPLARWRPLTVPPARGNGS